MCMHLLTEVHNTQNKKRKNEIEIDKVEGEVLKISL